jgi:hypothetical protein
MNQSELHYSCKLVKIPAKTPLKIFGFKIPFCYRSIQLEVSDDGIADSQLEGEGNGEASNRRNWVW